MKALTMVVTLTVMVFLLVVYQSPAQTPMTLAENPSYGVSIDSTIEAGLYDTGLLGDGPVNLGNCSEGPNRLIMQFAISSSIPISSTIDSVSLSIVQDGNFLGYKVGYVNIGTNISNPGSLNVSTIWNMFRTPADQLDAEPADSNGNINYTWTSGKVLAAVKNSLGAGIFVLGLFDTQDMDPNNTDCEGLDWWSATLKVVYTPPAVNVTVDQKLSGGSGASVDSIGWWLGSAPFTKYQAPYTFTFGVSNTEALQGTGKAISGQKYNYWAKNYGVLTDVTNFHSFQIDSTYASLTSDLQTRYGGIVVRNQLIDGPGLNGDSIAFKDPWRMDYPDPLYGNTMRNEGMSAPMEMWTSNPFRPDTTDSYNGVNYQGVFLNAGLQNRGSIQNPTPPYYSDSAKASVSIGGYTGNFLGWFSSSGATEIEYPSAVSTAVIFTAGTDTLSAVYKAHLASNSPNAFGSNLQPYNGEQKFIEDGLGNYYLAYEGSGSAYVDCSTNGGTSWNPEQLIGGLSNATTTYRSPSLFIEPESDSLTPYVVWEQVSGTSTVTHTIMIARVAPSGVNPASVTSQKTFHTYGDQYANPVAASSRGLTYTQDSSLCTPIEAIAWRDSAFLRCEAYYGAWMANVVGSNDPVTGSTSSSKNPAVACAYDYTLGDQNPYKIFLAWEEPGFGIKIKCGQFASLAFHISWTTLDSIANPANDTLSKPTIVCDYANDCFIAYECHTSSGASSIYVTEITFGGTIYNWTFTSPCGSSYISPALTDYRYTSYSNYYNITLVWNVQSIGIMAAQYTGTWGNPFIIPSTPTAQASIATTFIGEYNYSRYLMYVNSSGAAPYALSSSPVSIPSGEVPQSVVLYTGGVSTGQTQATLPWYCAQGATTYVAQVATNSAFTSGLQTAITSATSYTFTGLTCNTLYYWHVMDTNSYGSTAYSGAAKFTTSACSGGGGGCCPYVYTATFGGLTPENNIIPKSEAPGNIGVDVTDYYKLQEPPLEQNGRYEIKIGEFEHERSSLDQVQLIAVDHPAGTSITVQQDGRIIQYALPYRLVPDGTSLVSSLGSMDGKVVPVSKGETVRLSFQIDPDQVSKLKTILDGTVDPDSMQGGLVLGGATDHVAKRSPQKTQCQEGYIGGTSVDGEPMQFTFRELPAMFYTPLENLGTNLSLTFADYALLDYAALAVEIPNGFSDQPLQLCTASHSRLGDVTLMLSENDGEAVSLDPGENIMFEFAKPLLAKGMVRDFILVTHGRYTSETNSNIKETELPKDLSLSQNYPNPFNPTTQINYTLPQPSHVTLKVYNTLGVEVATLVDGMQQAGFRTAEFDATNFASGVYYYRMQAGKYSVVKKLVVMK
jgi:hypothetical protein